MTLFALAAKLLELGKNRFDIELFARVFRLGWLGLFLRRRGHRGGQQRGAGLLNRSWFFFCRLCTSRSRSICEQSPSVTGSSGVRLAEFQCVRSRIAWIVDLVVPTSRMIWLSLSSG